jgi:hypothetical protein
MAHFHPVILLVTLVTVVTCLLSLLLIVAYWCVQALGGSLAGGWQVS